MAGRMVLVSAAVLLLGGAAGCGQASSPSPSSPSSVPQTASAPIFAGIWQGQYKITTCEGERDCWFRVGSTRPYVLRLSQAGATITGIVEAMSFVVDVTGEVTKDGQVTLTGARPATSGWDGMPAVSISLTELRLDDGTGLAGEFSYTIDHSTSVEWPYAHLAHGATILGGTRGPLPVVSPAALAAYEGVWAGTYVIASCQFEGWADCWPETLDGAYTLALELRVNGDALEGELTLPGGTHLPVTATVSASGIVMRGAESHVVSGGTSSTSIETWKALRDAYDRLSGTFEYERRYNPTTGQPHVARYRATLAGVTRQVS